MPFILEVNDDGPGFGPDLKELARVIRFVADCVEESATSVYNQPDTKTLTAIVRDANESMDVAAWAYSKVNGTFGVAEVVRAMQEKKGSGFPFILHEKTKGAVDGDAEGGKE